MTEDTDPDRDGDDLTAAEYVLGVLSAAERAEVASRIENDATFARLVESWERRLMPLAEDYRAVEPPTAIKQTIDARLFPRPPQTRSRGLLDSLAFWRGIAAAAVVALVVVAVAPLFDEPRQAEPGIRYAASLQASDSDVSYLAFYDPGQDRLTLSHVSGERQPGRDFELWLIEGGNPPRSLGVLPAGTTVHLGLGADIGARLTDEVVLAISLEPAGGSPTGAPTGPVVAAGDTRRL